MPRNSLTRYTTRHLRIKRLVQFILVGAVYHNALTTCATRTCRALRRVARMCSRTVSGTAYRFRHGSTLCSPTEEKILCRTPYFGAVACRQSAPDYSRERGDSQEGGNRRCLPSCAPARRQRTPPLRFSEKLPARQGRTRLRQFASPAQSVLKKAAARKGRTRLRGSSAPEGRCRNQKAAPFSECCSELRMLTRS